MKKTSRLYFREIYNARAYYLMILPALFLLLVYKYLPIYGVTMAFKEFNIFKGIGDSPWVGLKYFEQLFSLPKFYQVFGNTIIISFLKLLFQFPVPIALAVLLNEVKSKFFKKTVQTVTYIPHFISWVIISGMFIELLSPSSGIANQVIVLFGGEPIHFMTEPTYFRPILILSHIWKESGYDAIIYLAAIAGVDQALYEAARVDGANWFKQIWHVTLPGIRSTIIVMLLLRLGNILEVGHEQILMMYSPTVYDSGDVLSTYIYRVGLGNMKYSLTAAAGLFKSAVGCTLLFISNKWAKSIGEDGIV